MNDSNKNAKSQPEKIRLVFDVMPGASSEAVSETPARDSTPEQSSQPVMPEPVSPPDQVSPAAPPTGKPARFKMPAFHFNRKWLFIFLALVILGVGGYFGYRFYQNSVIATQDKNSLTTARPDGEAAAMPESWLVKYFSKADCDPSVCAPSADPDSDGLTNSKEQEYGTHPKRADSDYDGLADSDETQVYNTDPLVADTDGDGFEDGSEVRNGYSPAAADSQPVSAIEKQVTDDNALKFGLHQPTQMFFAMSANKINFYAATGTAAALSVSLPSGWTLSQKENIVSLKSPNASSTLQIILSPDNPADDTNLKALWQTLTDFSGKGTDLGQSIEKVGNLTFHMDEYKIHTDDAQTSQEHGFRAVFIKQNRLFNAAFTTSETNWPAVKDEANVIIYSIR